MLSINTCVNTYVWYLHHFLRYFQYTCTELLSVPGVSLMFNNIRLGLQQFLNVLSRWILYCLLGPYVIKCIIDSYYHSYWCKSKMVRTRMCVHHHQNFVYAVINNGIKDYKCHCRSKRYHLPKPGPVFSLLLEVSSDYAQPITGQVTEVTCPVIGRAQSELTPSKRQRTGRDCLKSQARRCTTSGMLAEKGPVTLFTICEIILHEKI